MAERKRSWLDGPQIPGENDEIGEGKWPGERIGLPEKGSGAQASVARRAGAVLIDWVIAMIIASFIIMFTDALGGQATVQLLVWIVIGIVGGWLFARTPGMALLGMGVARIDVDGARVGLWRAAVRTILTAFVLPAALVDSDGRGMHDRATGTTVIMA
ncbi:RDD family protein [Corynebacterium lubricantis]|uniref:RDD family protein n=1 Tax=Corynebacterium lubricantis TaxID=541095 RepID=UPI00035ECC9B|nr:RDD family protein [Corynebacterium lubricantis]